MTTHYQILGVHSQSEPASIRAAYLSLMKRHHPDSRGAGESYGADVYRINLAYSVLRDAGRRAHYDAELLRERMWAAGIPGHDRRVPVLIPQRRRRSVLREAILLVAGVMVFAVMSGDVADPGLRMDPGLSLREAFVSPAEAAPAIVRPGGADVPELDPGIEDVVMIAAAVSLDDARSSSMRCFYEIHSDPALSSADRCIAFDLAFSYWHEGEFSGRPSEAYFQPSVTYRRHIRALDLVSRDEPTHRLDAIRAKTFSTLVDILDARSGGKIRRGQS